MKKVLIASAVALSTVQAWAADLPPAPPPRAPAVYAPPPPVFTWTGFYFGGNAGYGFATVDQSGTATGPFLPGGFTTTGSADANGFVGGGQIGANWQVQQLVFGIEGDWQWANQQTNFSAIVCPAPAPAGCTVSQNGEISWFATARGRLGVAFDRALWYVTGGAAWINVQHNVTSTLAGTTTTWLNPSTTAVGWTAGGGLEVALAQNWTARVEYLYMQADATLNGVIPASTITPGGGNITENLTIKNNVIRGAINFKFP